MENKSCWTPVLSQRERDKYNFLSIKVTEREARDLQVLSSKGYAGFIPLWRERELNWVDTHYWRRMGVQRVECGGREIRGTQRVNSLVLLLTVDRRRVSFPPPKTIGYS